MSCLCGASYTTTAPRGGDSDNNLLYKIAQSLSVIAGQSIPSGSPGTADSSFSTGPNITVLTAGVAVAGPDIATPRGVWVVARQGNTGSVYIGGSNVTNDSGGFRGAELVQTGMNSMLLPVSNLNQIYVNADNAGDRVGVVIL